MALTPWIAWAVPAAIKEAIESASVIFSSRICPYLGFLVIEQGICINRLVVLADVRVDADLPGQCFHPQGSGFIGDDGDDKFADLFITKQFSENSHDGKCCRDLMSVGALARFFKR